MLDLLDGNGRINLGGAPTFCLVGTTESIRLRKLRSDIHAKEANLHRVLCEGLFHLLAAIIVEARRTPKAIGQYQDAEEVGSIDAACVR